MRIVVWILIAVLIVLHQDTWYWDDATLILGFCPVGLAYHAALSIAASIVWILATRFAWPIPPRWHQQESQDSPVPAGGSSTV